MRENTTCLCRILLFLLLFFNSCDIFHQNKPMTVLCAKPDFINVEGKINNGPQFSYTGQTITYDEGDIIQYTCKRNSNDVKFVQWSHTIKSQVVLYGCYGNKDSIVLKMKLYHMDDDSVIECKGYDSNHAETQSVELKITVRRKVSPITKKIVKGTQLDVLFKMMECENKDNLYAASLDKKIIPDIWNITKKHDGMTLFCTSLNEINDKTSCVSERKIGTVKQINVVDKKADSIDALKSSMSFREVAKYVGMGILIVLIILVIIVCVIKKRKINQEIQIEERQELEAEPVNVTPHVIYAELQLGRVGHGSETDRQRDNEEKAYAEIIGVMAPRELRQAD